jgi:GT2 family glycosyltransferase
MLTPNCIEDSVRAIEEQGVDFIHGNAIEFNQQTGNKTIWKPSKLYPTLSELIAKNTIHSATTMYRREVFSKVGLFNETEQVRSFEELEFNIRCLQMGMKIGYCNSTLAFYRRHPNQLIKTTDKTRRNKNRKEVVDKFSKDVQAGKTK